jgi:hypothetical protein
MAFADDFSVAANGDIRHTSGTTNYTVLQMHRALQDLADDAVAAGDDLLDISVLTPSDRSTDNIVTLINGFNIDATAATFLYDGSVTQSDGNTIYAGLVVVGAVEAGTNIIIVQDNALLTDTWTAAPNANAAANILLRVLVQTRSDGADINGQRLVVMAREYGDTYAEFSVTMALGNNTAALFTAGDLNNATAQATVNAYDKIDNTEGYQELEISGTAPAEPYYSQWQVTGTGTLPASPVINDVYEFAKDIQRRGTAETIHGMSGSLFRGITHEWAYDGIVGVEPDTNEEYVWGTFLDVGAITGTYTVGEVVTGGTSLAVGRLLSVDATNTSLIISTESGTFANAEVVTGTTSAATSTSSAVPVGQATGGGYATVLAADTAGTEEMWVQLLRGSSPADNAICYEDTDHTREVTVFGSVTARSVSAPFIGASTGSALLGAFGVGLDPTDASASDLFIDLDGTAITPPNNVTFTVSGLVSTEDRVLVGPESGGIMQLDQFGISGTLSTDGITSVTMDTTIPTDTPSVGTFRLADDNGIYRRLHYSSYAGAVFTVDTADGNEDFASINCTTGNNLFISYIDELAGSATAQFTSVFVSSRALFIRVRDGGTAGDAEGIKTFETTGTLGASGGSSTAIRTSDA